MQSAHSHHLLGTRLQPHHHFRIHVRTTTPNHHQPSKKSEIFTIDTPISYKMQVGLRGISYLSGWTMLQLLACQMQTKIRMQR